MKKCAALCRRHRSWVPRFKGVRVVTTFKAECRQGDVAPTARTVGRRRSWRIWSHSPLRPPAGRPNPSYTSTSEHPKQKETAREGGGGKHRENVEQCKLLHEQARWCCGDCRTKYEGAAHDTFGTHKPQPTAHTSWTDRVLRVRVHPVVCVSDIHQPIGHCWRTLQRTCLRPALVGHAVSNVMGYSRWRQLQLVHGNKVVRVTHQLVRGNKVVRVNAHAEANDSGGV